MLKAILATLLGLGVTAAGLYLVYLYLLSLNDTGKPLFLLSSLPLVIIGLFLLIRAGNSNKLIDMNDETAKDALAVQIGNNLESIVEKNNRIVSEWIKEGEKKDSLKILEIAAAAEEENRKKASGVS